MASLIPDHPDTLLTRAAAAQALNASGYPIRPATLATKASRGGGPPFPAFWAGAALPLGRYPRLGAIASKPTDVQHIRGRLIMNAAEIAAALGDVQREGRRWRCRCPLHGGRSLTLCDGESGCVLVTCWSGCDRTAILAELRRQRLINEQIRGGDYRSHLAAERDRREAKEHRRQSIVLARQIWSQTSPAHGTVVNRYLASRGIKIPVPPTLRFLDMSGRYGRHPCGEYRPQVVGLVEHVDHGLVGVSRTFLAADGFRKASLDPARMFHGPVGGGAVRLAAAQSDRWLVVAEGVETTLSVMQACELPGWAALSASGVEHLVLPPEARMVLIVADHDANRTGERAARRAAERWLYEGRRVRIVLPPVIGTDANDLLKGARHVAA